MRRRIARLYCIEANDTGWGRGLVDWRGFRVSGYSLPQVFLSARDARREIKHIWLSAESRRTAKPKVVAFRKVKVR